MQAIDISTFQGNIDFQKVKKAGVKAVIIRAGYGKNNIDAKFRQNAEKAIAAGIPVGIYWFSYAYTPEMARKEAEHCIAAIKPYKITLPVFFDWEDDSLSYAKKNGVTPDKALVTEMHQEFMGKIQSAGYKAGFYANPNYLKLYINEKKLKGFYKWLAYWTKTEQKNCDIWQYSDKGKIDGISGAVDLDKIVNESLLKETSTQEPAKETTKEPEKKPAKNTTKVSETKMPTIRNGSRGKAVQIWQIIVGCTADGIFGSQTLAATRTFQTRHKLTVDGIVGPNTWKAGLESVK